MRSIAFFIFFATSPHSDGPQTRVNEEVVGVTPTPPTRHFVCLQPLKARVERRYQAPLIWKTRKSSVHAPWFPGSDNRRVATGKSNKDITDSGRASSFDLCLRINQSMNMCPDRPHGSQTKPISLYIPETHMINSNKERIEQNRRDAISCTTLNMGHGA